MKKTILAIITLIFLTSCGFTPIYSTKNLNFQIESVKFEGDKKIKSIVLPKLSPYFGNENNIDNYQIEINVNKKIEIVSKNTKGEAQVYRIKINSKVKFFLDKKLILNKDYVNTANFKNVEKKIILKDIENKNLSTLASKLTDEIILDLSLRSSKK